MMQPIRGRPVAWAGIALAAVAACAALIPAEPPAGRKYAVLVGVKEYDHSKLRPLDYPEADVTELADVLRGAGYEVTLLTTAAREEKLRPTLANIYARLAEVLEKCKRHDTVLVGLSGHGLQFDGQRDAFFCPQDARPLPERTETLLSLAGLYKRLDESGAGVKLLLADACRDDPKGKGSKGVNADSSPRPPAGVAALFSCSAGEQSFESDKLKHGVFFYYVLEGLKGKAGNDEKEVTWDGLQQYVRRRVSRDVGGLIGGVRQTPALSAGELAGEPPVLLVLKGSDSPGQPGSTEVKREPSRPLGETRPSQGREIHRLPHPNMADCVAFSPDGTKLATGCHDGIVRIWDVAKGVVLKQTAAHVTPPPNPTAAAVYSVAWSPDGKQVVSASLDRTLKPWDAAAGTLVREFKAYKPRDFEKGHREGVFTVAFSPDGKTIASGGSDRTIKIWDVGNANVLRECLNPNLKPGDGGPVAHPGWVYSLCFTPDGERLVSVGPAPMNGGFLGQWGTRDGKLLSGEELPGGPCHGVSLSSDGKIVAIARGPGSRGAAGAAVLVRELETGKQLARLEGHTETVYSVAVCPGARRVLSGGFDHTVRLWSVETGKEVGRLNGHENLVLGVAIASDGRHAASAGADNSVRVWELPAD
jgi:WD40 repeat protein